MGEIAVRSVRVALRAVAAAALAAGVILASIAWSAGDHGVSPSLLVMVAPAVLVWFRPHARTIGVWAGFAWFSALMLILGKDEAAVEPWLDVFLPVLLAVLPIAGYAASAFTGERMIGDPTPLARKLRSIASVTFLLAACLAAIGFLPGERLADHTRPAGGLSLLVLLAVAVGPGFHVHTNPTRTHGWRWTLYGMGLVLPGAALWSLAHGASYGESLVTLWPRRAVELGVGTLLVLLLFVMPAILLFTRGDDDPQPTTLPPARLR